MENTSRQRPSWSWMLALLSPMALALALLAASSQQNDLHDKILLTTIGNLMVAVGIAMQGVYWLVARKSLAIGITALVVGSVLFGFGLHTLLRVLGL